MIKAEALPVPASWAVRVTLVVASTPRVPVAGEHRGSFRVQKVLVTRVGSEDPSRVDLRRVPIEPTAGGDTIGHKPVNRVRPGHFAAGSTIPAVLVTAAENPVAAIDADPVIVWLELLGLPSVLRSP